jgi:acetoacetate decarboxylase
VPGISSLSPLYPDPPYEYRNQRVWFAIVESPTPDFSLPEGLAAADPSRTIVVFADRPGSTLGPYNEAVVLAPASFNGAEGLYCPLIYVDTDISMRAGREIWGLPKKLAEIVIDERDGIVDARVTRGGEQLLRLSAHVTEFVDVAALAVETPRTATYCHKVIPSVAVAEPSIDTLTSVLSEAVIHEAWRGMGTVEAAGEALSVLNAVSRVEVTKQFMDSVLPAGEVLR